NLFRSDVWVARCGHLPACPIFALWVLASVEEEFEVIHTARRREKPGLTAMVGESRPDCVLPDLAKLADQRGLIHYDTFESAASYRLRNLRVEREHCD